MTDINTNNSANTINKSKKELKQEKQKEKFAAKLEKQRVIALSRLEAKKNKLTHKLNAAISPKKKSAYQNRIDVLNKDIENIKNSTSTKKPFRQVMKVWRKGLRKEARRVNWTKKRDLSKDFVTIILVCAFLAVIFFAIDMIVISLR